MDAINQQQCANIANTAALGIDTMAYAPYNYYILADYMRSFAIMGLCVIIINAIFIYIDYDDRVNYERAWIIIAITIILFIINGLGITGMAMVLFTGDIYNIIERTRIYNVQSQTAACQISLAYDGTPNLYGSILSQVGLGFMRFSLFILLVALIISFAYILKIMLFNIKKV